MTYSDKDWDEHAHYSPDGKQIAWMSSRGFTIDYGTKGDERLAWNVDMSDAEARLKTELWVINTDGSNPRQLKHFNTPDYPEHVDGTNCIVADSVWAPDGKSIVAGVFTMKGKSRHAKLMRIELQ